MVGTRVQFPSMASGQQCAGFYVNLAFPTEEITHKQMRNPHYAQIVP